MGAYVGWGLDHADIKPWAAHASTAHAVLTGTDQYADRDGTSASRGPFTPLTGTKLNSSEVMSRIAPPKGRKSAP